MVQAYTDDFVTYDFLGFFKFWFLKMMLLVPVPGKME